MSEDAALLAAIRLHPDEDTPRLVYADWLEEHDQSERAAFIRLQCEAARLPPGNEANAKTKQAERLLKANKTAWFGPLWKAFHFNQHAPHFINRGFITSLEGIVAEYVGHAEAITQFAPCLRTVIVSHVEDDLSELLANPFIMSVAELNLETLHSESVEVLNESPAWGSFDTLRLNFEFDDADHSLAGLSDAPLVQAAKRLEVQYGYFLDEDDDTDDNPAAQEPSLREMHRLKMRHLRGFGIHGINAESAAEMASWPGFKRLDCLDMGLCNIEDAVAVTLLTSPNLPKLTVLKLNENSVGRRTVKAIAECPKLTELKFLTLSWLSLSDADAKRLIASKWLPAKLAMEVSYNSFSERTLAKLRERFGPEVVSKEQL